MEGLQCPPWLPAVWRLHYAEIFWIFVKPRVSSLFTRNWFSTCQDLGNRYSERIDWQMLLTEKYCPKLGGNYIANSDNVIELHGEDLHNVWYYDSSLKYQKNTTAKSAVAKVNHMSNFQLIPAIFYHPKSLTCWYFDLVSSYEIFSWSYFFLSLSRFNTFP